MTGEKGATAETALPRQMLDGPRAGWSVGTFGAIAEFLRDPGEAARPGPDAEAWAAVHRAFHMGLLAGCGSVWQMHLAELLFDQAERFRNIRAREVPTVRLNRDTTHEHTELFEAAMQRRTDDALAALDAHYRATMRDVLDSIDAGAGGATNAGA